MKKIIFAVVAGSLFLSAHMNASEASLDQKIETAFQNFEKDGGFQDLNNSQIDALQEMVKDRVITLNLKPEFVDQAFLGSLISTGLSLIKNLGGKVIGKLASIGESLIGKLAGAIGGKGTAIVNAIVGKVKGITGDQVKEVVKNVAATAAQDMAASTIADLATSAVKKVTGKVVPEDDKKDAIVEGTAAAAEEGVDK